MGKVGQYLKPQRSNKHKKIKAIDPFYTGDRVADRYCTSLTSTCKLALVNNNNSK